MSAIHDQGIVGRPWPTLWLRAVPLPTWRPPITIEARAFDKVQKAVVSRIAAAQGGAPALA
jgi:hypothetical protein